MAKYKSIADFKRKEDARILSARKSEVGYAKHEAIAKSVKRHSQGMAKRKALQNRIKSTKGYGEK